MSLMLGNTQVDGLGDGVAVYAHPTSGHLAVDNYVFADPLWVPMTQPSGGTGGTGGAGTEFAEDAVHTSGAFGSLVLGVRRDADTTPVSADGDYHSTIYDQFGNLKVVVKQPLPTGANTIGKVTIGTLGQQARAASVPVTLATDQPMIPVTLATGLNILDDSVNIGAISGVAPQVDTNKPAVSNYLHTGTTAGGRAQYGTWQQLAIASAARTTAPAAVAVQNFNHRTLIIHLVVTGRPNTADTLQVIFDALVANVPKELIAPATIPGTATVPALYSYVLGGSQGGYTTGSAAPVPAFGQVRTVHVGTGSWTYAVYLDWIL